MSDSVAQALQLAALVLIVVSGIAALRDAGLRYRARKARNRGHDVPAGPGPA